MKIGVFDIGTKAVRLLVGDSDILLEETFSFEPYRNFGDRTFLGDALINNQFEIKRIEPTLMKIKEYVQYGKRRGVNKFIAVGTAVFRKATNTNDVIQLIKDNTGVDIKVLTMDEEAKLSMIAAIYSGKDYIDPGDSIALIDQGGGSTEISFAKYSNDNDIQFESFQSLDLGSVELKNRIFNYDATFENVYQMLIEDAKVIIQSHKTFKTSAPIKAFGMGNGITNMTGRKGNKNQHGIEFSPEKIQYISDSTLKQDSYLRWERQPNEEFPDGIKRTISSLKKMYENNRDLIDRPLSILLGRIAFKEILEFYKIKRIRVCGAGLRYGVFFSEVLKL